MKKLMSLTALLIFALACSTPTGVSSQVNRPKSQATPAEATTSAQAQAMQRLRDKFLTSTAEDLGLSGKDAKAKVWGVLFEVSFPNGTATILSVRDGTASLYTSTGGGVLGGYSARNEAKRFVVEAEKHLANMKPTKAFPYPEAGHIKFYVLTPGGVYTAEADEQELLSENHALFPLFAAGNEVLTALRNSSGPAKPR